MESVRLRGVRDATDAGGIVGIVQGSFRGGVDSPEAARRGDAAAQARHFVLLQFEAGFGSVCETTQPMRVEVLLASYGRVPTALSCFPSVG